MAAYAAVVSLKQTINGLVNSPRRISLLSSIREILEFAYNETTSLQQVLQRLDYSSKKLDALESQIRDCANKLEDVVEFHELDDDEEMVRQEITSFVQTVKTMEKYYIEEEDEDEAASSNDIDLGVELMVGHSDEFTNMEFLVQRRMRPDDLCFFAFFGKHGSGRTAAAMAVFEEEVHNFDCSAWVTIGEERQTKRVLMRVIDQIEEYMKEKINYNNEVKAEDEWSISELCDYLYVILRPWRYMIVLDDVRDVEVVQCLRSSLGNESSLFQISPYACLRIFKTFMCTVLFGGEEFPPEYEQVGNKIIDNCGCRSIAGAKTMLFLIRTEKSVEHWSNIAADEENLIFMVEDEISEVCNIKTEMMKSYYWDMDEENKNALVFGKTTFARKIFNDKSLLGHFKHHVWITLGQKYRNGDILIDILAQVYPDIDKLHMKGDEELTRVLCILLQLSRNRCFIVLDDVYRKEPIHHLKNLFPDMKGTILVTTRLAEVAKFDKDDTDIEMHLLDIEESWYLLRQKVFGEGSCPPELEKVGRKIAEKCDGLPLLILTVADQLLKVNNMSEEYWNNVVALGKEKQVFMNAHHQISKALLPSYLSLPHLKACFLYIGVFLEKYETSPSKLTNMWIAEGFVEPNSSQMVEDYVAECLSELVEKSLVVVQRKVSDHTISTCRLHVVFWHLCNSQAAKNKFFHAMNSYDDCLIDSLKSQRRLCIRNSNLLGIKDVQLSMASNTSAHSLLCVGPLQQYPVPLNFEFRLLRVMNALTIRLFEFPVEVVRLVHLRYLSLTCNGKLPNSISKLWKLQYLIVKRYVNIRLFDNSWALPAEIWDMTELKHLQVVGGWIPNRKCGNGLRKLSTLLDVSVQSCRKKVLKWIPNLKRLGIQIELVPGDEGNSFRCLNRISRLHKLESLKCVVVNPQMRSPPPVPISMFPARLKKLSLSGLGYPWSYMSIIGNLKHLQVLKLKHYAFQGPEWEMDYTSPFHKLKFLLIEDTDLVHWKVNSFIPMWLD